MTTTPHYETKHRYEYIITKLFELVKCFFQNFENFLQQYSNLKLISSLLGKPTNRNRTHILSPRIESNIILILERNLQYIFLSKLYIQYSAFC